MTGLDGMDEQLINQLADRAKSGGLRIAGDLVMGDGSRSLRFSWQFGPVQRSFIGVRGSTDLL